MQQSFAGELFIPWVVIDQRNGALLAGKIVIIDLVIFGIEQMDMRTDVVEVEDLFLQRNKGVPFFGVACDGFAADREFDAQLRFDIMCCST